jgi:aspartate kinase
LPEITFAEAIELSYYGAKVIHHKAIRPAMERGIPVLIKNSFAPQVPGTRIAASGGASDAPIKAVTAIANAALITLCARHDLYVAADILGRLFLRLGHDHVDVLFSTQSSAENSLGLVLRGEDADRVQASIERVFRSEIKHGVLKGVDIVRDLAVVAVLGERMKGVPGILARLFTSVSKCNVSVIAAAQGASELSICFAVPSRDASAVVKAVHDEFFLPRESHAYAR